MKLKPIGMEILFLQIQSVRNSIDIGFEYSNGHLTFTEGAQIYDDGDMHGTDVCVESGDVLLWQKLMVTMVCRSSETGLLQS